MTTRQSPSLPLAVGRRSEVHDEIATVGFATNDHFLLRETDRYLEFRIIVDVMIIADARKIVVIHLKLQHDRIRSLGIAERPIKIDIAIFRHVFLITPQSSQRTHWLVRADASLPPQQQAIGVLLDLVHQRRGIVRVTSYPAAYEGTRLFAPMVGKKRCQPVAREEDGAGALHLLQGIEGREKEAVVLGFADGIVEE